MWILVVQVLARSKPILITSKLFVEGKSVVSYQLLLFIYISKEEICLDKTSAPRFETKVNYGAPQELIPHLGLEMFGGPEMMYAISSFEQIHWPIIGEC